MNEDKAPAELRFLIRDVAGGAGDGDSLANVNTVPLPNGATAFVNEDQSIWNLDKTSERAPLTGYIIAPVSGPGRWLRMVSSDASAPAIEVVTTGYADYALSGNFAPSSSTVFGLSLPATPQWSIESAGGILTYHGPRRIFLATVTASARVVDVTVPREVAIAVSYNGDMTGGPVAGVDMITTASIAGGIYSLSTQRLVEMRPDDTLSVVAATSPSASQLSIGLKFGVSPA